MLISVLIPTYNRQNTITRAIRSILDQTISKLNYEIIVIDDGSTDDTCSVLSPFLKDINLISLPSNVGLPAALNEGIKQSHGQFIVRLDSDDYVLSAYLEILSLALRLNNSIDAVACDYQLVDMRENVIKTVNCMEEPIACGIMYRTQQIHEIGLFNPSFRLFEDREFRRRFLRQYSYTRLPIPLYKYLMHDTNLSKNQQMISYYTALLEE